MHNEEGTKLDVACGPKSSFHYGDPKFNKLKLKANILNFINGWNHSLKAQLVSFDDVTPSERKSFTRQITHAGQSVEYSWGEDDGNYTITITNVPLIPEKKSDAKRWLFSLLVDHVRGMKAHIPLPDVEDILDATIDDTPFTKKYKKKELAMPGKEFMKMLKSEEDNEELWYTIRTADDLDPREVL